MLNSVLTGLPFSLHNIVYIVATKSGNLGKKYRFFERFRENLEKSRENVEKAFKSEKS